MSCFVLGFLLLSNPSEKVHSGSDAVMADARANNKQGERQLARARKLFALSFHSARRVDPLEEYLQSTATGSLLGVSKGYLLMIYYAE
jgi:hypothetical protein